MISLLGRPCGYEAEPVLFTSSREGEPMPIRISRSLRVPVSQYIPISVSSKKHNQRGPDFRTSHEIP
jgi:hypothetical protein